MGQPGDEDAASAQGEVVVGELDRRLVRAMFAPGLDHLDARRTPLRELADTLDVHRNTVSNRLRRLREAGLFLPPVLGIDPTMLGHASAILHIQAPENAPGSVDREACFAVDGVEALLTLLDGWMVPLHGRDAQELERRADVLTSLLPTGQATWHVAPGEYRTPDEPVAITDLDIRVVEALLGDARRAFRDVAQDVGVSPKTVRRRYHRLQEADVLYFAPSGYTGAQGATLVLVEAATKTSPDEAKSQILDIVDDVLFPNFDTRSKALLYVWTPAMARLSGQLDALRGLDVVERIRQHVVAETCTNPRIGDWIGPMLHDAEAAPG